MTTANDEKILKLKKQVDDKKKELKLSERFIPVTNCSIELDGVRQNIQVLNKDQIVFLLVKLNSLKMSAKELGLQAEFSVSGFSVDDWLTDLKSRLSILNRNTEMEKLRNMESKLEKLLSDDKKTELEIDDIAKSLGVQ